MTSNYDIFMWVLGIITGFMLGILYVVNAVSDLQKDQANTAPEPVLTCPSAKSGGNNVIDNTDEETRHD